MTEIQTSAQVALYASEQIGGPYIMGATAQGCTPKYRRSLANGRSADYADMIADSCQVLSGKQSSCTGCKWQGRIAHDCAQLTRFAAKSAGLTLPSGATSQWQDGDWAAPGLIADLPRGYVAFVYRRRDGRMVHTGVLDVDGTVIEARGHADGVLRRDVTDYPWTHWAILRGMAVPPGAGLLRPTLRKGAVGEDVRSLQEALLAAGYDCGDVDGVFGKATRAAVKSLQKDMALEVDGIVGDVTWAMLDKLASSKRYTVTIHGLTEPVAQRILREYGGQMEAVAGGGEPNG